MFSVWPKWPRKWEGKDVDESPIDVLKIFFFTKAIFGPLLVLFIWCDCDQTIITSCQRISGNKKPGQNKPSLGSTTYIWGKTDSLTASQLMILLVETGG